MPENGNGNRTHEPGLREITGELDGLRELHLSNIAAIRELLDERDRFYLVQFKAAETAVKAALDAAKEQVITTFNSSEKAIVKAENAQKDYNERTNEFRGQLSDQAKTFMPRIEVDRINAVLEDKISRLDLELRGLRESRSNREGTVFGIKSAWGILTALITTISLAISALFALFRR
jgi:hypothetical protein